MFLSYFYRVSLFSLFRIVIEIIFWFFKNNNKSLVVDIYFFPKGDVTFVSLNKFYIDRVYHDCYLFLTVFNHIMTRFSISFANFLDIIHIFFIKDAQVQLLDACFLQNLLTKYLISLISMSLTLLKVSPKFNRNLNTQKNKQGNKFANETSCLVGLKAKKQQGSDQIQHQIFCKMK